MPSANLFTSSEFPAILEFPIIKQSTISLPTSIKYIFLIPSSDFLPSKSLALVVVIFSYRLQNGTDIFLIQSQKILGFWISIYLGIVLVFSVTLFLITTISRFIPSDYTINSTTMYIYIHKSRIYGCYSKLTRRCMLRAL